MIVKYGNELTEEERKAADRASNIYHHYYQNHLYAAAILSDDGVNNLSNDYCNELIDQALAVCGDPHYLVIDRIFWSEKANAFLDVFRNAVKERS